MDENVAPNMIIELVLKGGPPWGFRIKEKNNAVIISKINCGGRAMKNGLKQNDEIIAVNNLEIDKHPLTLARHSDDEENKELFDDFELTKLDFTYQLIKHTINHHLHLKIKRTNLNEQSQSCCYPHTDDEDKEGSIKLSNGNRPELSENTNFKTTCIHQNNLQQAPIQPAAPQNGIHQNGNLKVTNQLHHSFADYKTNFNEDQLILSPNETDFNNRNVPNYPTSQQFNKYLNQINTIGANRFQTNDPKELNNTGYPLNAHHQNIHPLNQSTVQKQECTAFIHNPNHPLYSAQPNLPNHLETTHQLQTPNLICDPQTTPQTATIVQQPLQFLIEDQSDLNTTDINMDSSPCSESASDLNRQFSTRPHKDVWSPGSTTTSTSTGSNSSCEMHSDSTVKLDSVNALLQTDPNLANIPLTNVNNLSLNNIGEMNMVLGLGRLDLSNMQQQQQQPQQPNDLNQINQINQMNQINQLNQMNQMNQINQMNQMNQFNQLGPNQINQNQLNQLNQIPNMQQPNVQQDTTNLLIQQQQAQAINQQLPGYYLSNTPIASNIRPIVLDHNNNAINLANLSAAGQFVNRDEQLLNEQLTNRIISPSTQSETSTNTQTSKKIGIRVGSPPPEMEFKCWTLPRYIQQQPFIQQQPTARHYSPSPISQKQQPFTLNYASQFADQNSLMSTRKQFDAQQFASQILYSKQNQMNADLESPQSNSQPDLLVDHQTTQQSITPTPNQQFYNYYPVHMHLDQAGLPNSYAKFCYETATHKYYTIPASIAQRGSLNLIAPPPSRYSDRTVKRRKQRRKQLNMSKKLSKPNSDNSSEETDNELDNDGDDEIDLNLLRDEDQDEEDDDEIEDERLASDKESEDADNQEKRDSFKDSQKSSQIETVKQNLSNQQQSQDDLTQQPSTSTRKESGQKTNQQHLTDPNTKSTLTDHNDLEIRLADESSNKEVTKNEDDKSKNDKDNKRKKVNSNFICSKKSKKSIKKSINKKRPPSKIKSERQMSANELLKIKLRQAKKRIELVNLLNDEEKKHTGKIADYLPGRSSVLIKEKQKFYANLISYIDSIFNEVFSSSESLSDFENLDDRRTAMSMGKIEDVHQKNKELQRKKRQQQLRKLQRHHQHTILSKNCAFNVLISDDTTTNGYESDSSYIVRRREPIPAPVSRSVYSSVQRGEDIPFEGLRRSKQYMRDKDVRKPLTDSKDNVQTDQLNRYLDKELDWINHETSLLAQRRHHFNISPQQQVLSFNRYKYSAANKSASELSKALLAKVLYDFRAVYGRELSVKKDDIVIVIRSVNNNWVEVEDIESGLKGFVPRNFLDYEQEGLAKAKYDFEASTGVEVSFKKDEILRLIRKVDNNWFEGMNTKNESGIIPINYIEVMRLPLNLHYDNQFLNIICKGQSVTPQSHPYTRSAVSTPQSSYFSSNIRAKQIGSQPNLSIDTIIESDSANSTNNHQPNQIPPPPSFFNLRSSSAMCQNKTLSQLQTSSIEQFSQKASLAASAPHLIDDIEQSTSIDKQQQTTNASTSTNNQSQQPPQTTSQTQTNQQQTSTNNQKSSTTITSNQPQKPLHPPLPLQSDFASTTSLATSSISQIPTDNNSYQFRNQPFYYQQQQLSQNLPHPRNLANINNHLNLNKPLPTHNLNANNATSNSHLALKKLYRVIYPYKPQQNDELELFAGDIVSVSMHCDDGWFIGFSTLSGRSGTFPGNYVCPLH